MHVSVSCRCWWLSHWVTLTLTPYHSGIMGFRRKASKRYTRCAVPAMIVYVSYNGSSANVISGFPERDIEGI
ncbi:hypothetical protein H4582DRAFT_1951800 [Lactarius indigo]|nr:hypothetical protein H4582DRAFT_1951800 [Lactarius indigo]